MRFFNFRILFLGFLLFSTVSCTLRHNEDKDSKAPETINGTDKNTFTSDQLEYNPRFWLEGIDEWIETDERLPSESAQEIVDRVKERGWDGFLFWGADRDGNKMNCYFNSPFLARKDWANIKYDGLSPLLNAAHAIDLKVMVNIEGVNPYHWEQNQWTAENIKEVAIDLANAGVDAVFEECFEVKPDVFISLARTLNQNGVDYISGTDPMLLREPHFTALWPETGTINIYNYYLKRDKLFNIATLTQHGSLGYGWAKYWDKPTSLISPLNRNWGIATDYSPAVVKYLCMIRALQFRLDEFIIFGGSKAFDPVSTREWISKYLDRQEKNRPLLNIVVLLEKYNENQGSEKSGLYWNRLFNSGDAITSGAMNAGYNILVSDKVVPADAYWIYATGGVNETLPMEVVELFKEDNPVFIQCATSIPIGSNITTGWETVLEGCGIDGKRYFKNNNGKKWPSVHPSQAEQEVELPYTGYYKDVYLRFTGTDNQRGLDMRTGTIIPEDLISGEIYCRPNTTYGKGPFIVGKNDKFLVTANTLNWEVAYPISDLLSGSGILPSSNVWGIAGENVTALLAIETTDLIIKIPGLEEGTKIRVEIWDKFGNSKTNEILFYTAPLKWRLEEYDFIVIDKALN